MFSLGVQITNDGTTAAPVDAAHGHCYSVWRYPWAQRCHVAHAQFRAAVSREKAAIQLPPDRDIPLPFLSRGEVQGGEPDDITRARLQLMGYAYGH